ncbi:uncharacterized protein LOC135347050 isoform X2 [Halichondria panicea]|uniref:uncharacterized protein LOC135347050 isoform X2 n=1 Tax=Halichondria panicea TaxID=6063 RepID=UPI00312B4D9E
MLSVLMQQFRKVYPAIIDSFEEFRYYHFKLQTLDGISTEPDDFCKCPACPQDGERGGIVHISYDAMFGLCRKKAAGVSIRNPHHQGRYFVDQKEVDNFMNSYSSTKKASKKGCNDFLAGSIVRSRQRYAALDETAVAGLACRHESPLKFLNFKFGERIGYAVYLLDKLLELYSCGDISILFLYDIGCLLKHHLELEFSPRFQEGFGLTDGEVLERLWSYMRRFSKMTKEMRPSHRIDVLNDALGHFAYQSSMNLGDILVERMKKAVNLVQGTSSDLEALRTDSSGDPVFTSNDIKRWYAEDKSKGCTTSENMQVHVENVWQESYVEHLQSFWAIQCDLQSCTDVIALSLFSRKLIRLNHQLQHRKIVF